MIHVCCICRSRNSENARPRNLMFWFSGKRSGGSGRWRGKDGEEGISNVCMFFFGRSLTVVNAVRCSFGPFCFRANRDGVCVGGRGWRRHYFPMFCLFVCLPRLLGGSAGPRYILFLFGGR